MARLVRKAFFVDPVVLRKLRRALGAPSEAEALRRVARWYVESDAIKTYLRRTAGKLPPDSFEHDAA